MRFVEEYSFCWWDADSHPTQKGFATIFARHLGAGTELGVFDTKSHGIVNQVLASISFLTNLCLKLQVAMDASYTPSGGVVARLLVTTSSGAIQLWQQGELAWTREESLAATTLAGFGKLPERVASESNLHISGEEFVSRVISQTSDAQVPSC